MSAAAKSEGGLSVHYLFNYTMKRTYITLLIIITSLNLNAQTWQWARRAGGTSSDNGYSITTDPSGYIYATGYFSLSSATFGGTTLSNAGGWDPFLIKYDASGNMQWATSWGGTSTDVGNGIAADASGNLYVTGYYNSTAIFGGTTLSSAGGGDLFLVKSDPNGSVLWAQRAGGANAERGTSVATDATSGDVYITGFFSSSSVSFGSNTLTNSGAAGTNDIFFVKYNSSGTVQWAKSFGGTWTSDEGYGIATDVAGNIYISGEFQSSSVVFGSITLTNINPVNTDCFIAKYDANGNALWAQNGIGSTTDDNCRSISTDVNNNVYATGFFSGSSITFGGTTLTNPACCLPEIFIVKYDQNGNVLWAKQGGGTSNDWGFGTATDASANVYVSGTFQSSTIAFGSTTLTNAGGMDFFLSKYDVNGNVVWAVNNGGTGNDGINTGNDVATSASGDVYVAGTFASTSITFGSDVLNDAGSNDIFIAKMGGTLPIELISFEGKLNDGKINLRWSTTSENNNDYFTIEKRSSPIPTFPFGEGVWTAIGTVQGAGNSNAALSYNFTDHSPFPWGRNGDGLVYYRLKQVDYDGKFTYSNIISVTQEHLNTVIAIYPNPSEDFLYYQLTLNESAMMITTVVDIFGKSLIQEQKELNKGINNLKLNINNLSEGMYFLRINNNRPVKFIKQ